MAPTSMTIPPLVIKVLYDFMIPLKRGVLDWFLFNISPLPEESFKGTVDDQNIKVQQTASPLRYCWRFYPFLELTCTNTGTNATLKQLTRRSFFSVNNSWHPSACDFHVFSRASIAEIGILAILPKSGPVYHLNKIMLYLPLRLRCCAVSIVVMQICCHSDLIGSIYL